jgi:molecular chaperone GrpE (heat shock protein)
MNNNVELLESALRRLRETLLRIREEVAQAPPEKQESIATAVDKHLLPFISNMLQSVERASVSQEYSASQDFIHDLQILRGLGRIVDISISWSQHRSILEKGEDDVVYRAAVLERQLSKQR